MKTVTLILTKDGKVTCIYQDQAAAEYKVRQYNADPFIDGDPDPDAPYTAQTWALYDEVKRKR